ncbi:MAG: Hsp20/alpha crystallin family protein [Candidatus Buchananbacteria bacterium]
MPIIKWTPFPFVDSFDEAEKIMGDWPITAGSFTPAIDVYEDKDNVVVEAPLAGIDPDKVEIAIENNILTIKGENEKKTEVEDKNYYRKEVRTGSFYRSVALPSKVESDKAQAAYDKGILKITLPKSPEAKPKTIKVNITK